MKIIMMKNIVSIIMMVGGISCYAGIGGGLVSGTQSAINAASAINQFTVTNNWKNRLTLQSNLFLVGVNPSIVGQSLDPTYNGGRVQDWSDNNGVELWTIYESATGPGFLTIANVGGTTVGTNYLTMGEFGATDQFLQPNTGDARVGTVVFKSYGYDGVSSLSGGGGLLLASRVSDSAPQFTNGQLFAYSGFLSPYGRVMIGNLNPSIDSFAPTQQPAWLNLYGDGTYLTAGIPDMFISPSYLAPSGFTNILHNNGTNLVYAGSDGVQKTVVASTNVATAGSIPTSPDGTNITWSSTPTLTKGSSITITPTGTNTTLSFVSTNASGVLGTNQWMGGNNISGNVMRLTGTNGQTVLLVDQNSTVTAGNFVGLINASNVNGVLASSAMPSIFTNAVYFTNAAGITVGGKNNTPGQILIGSGDGGGFAKLYVNGVSYLRTDIGLQIGGSFFADLAVFHLAGNGAFLFDGKTNVFTTQVAFAVFTNGGPVFSPLYSTNGTWVSWTSNNPSLTASPHKYDRTWDVQTNAIDHFIW